MYIYNLLIFKFLNIKNIMIFYFPIYIKKKKKKKKKKKNLLYFILIFTFI